MRKICTALCILWIGIIFYNSSQPATISGGVSENLVCIIRNIVKGQNIELKNKNVSYNNISSSFKSIVKEIFRRFKVKVARWKRESVSGKIYKLIRKIAHGLEFFILSILIIFILSEKNIDRNYLIIKTLFIVLIVAILDEYLQAYIPGRGSTVSDILIDFIGGIFGIIVFKFINNIIYGHKIDRKNKDKEKKLEIG